jgi:hypothetical protein
MGERRCRYCKKVFQPSKFQPRQAVCSEPICQAKRRGDYHRTKIAADPEYRDVCRDSPRKWRARNPDYWRRYREKNPACVERNRQRQQLRDRKRRLGNLANNTSALDLKHSAAQVWLVGSGAVHLADNNSGCAQVWVIEALPPRAAPSSSSCKQHPSVPAAGSGA